MIQSTVTSNNDIIETVIARVGVGWVIFRSSSLSLFVADSLFREASIHHLLPVPACLMMCFDHDTKFGLVGCHRET